MPNLILGYFSRARQDLRPGARPWSALATRQHSLTLAFAASAFQAKPNRAPFKFGKTLSRAYQIPARPDPKRTAALFRRTSAEQRYKFCLAKLRGANSIVPLPSDVGQRSADAAVHASSNDPASPTDLPAGGCLSGLFHGMFNLSKTTHRSSPPHPSIDSELRPFCALRRHHQRTKTKRNKYRDRNPRERQGLNDRRAAQRYGASNCSISPM